MLISIKNIRLRTIIGINTWEREKKQDIIINMKIEFDGSKPGQSDDIQDTLDYKSITKSVIDFAENSSFYLIEKLATEIIDMVMANPMVQYISVEIDKPHALRFADSVSITSSRKR